MTIFMCSKFQSLRMYFIEKNKRGIKNIYRENIPFAEKLFKDIAFQLRELYNYLANGFSNRTLLIYPEFPSSKTLIRKLCSELNINMTNKIERNFNAAIFYEDSTVRTHFTPLEGMRNIKIVNLNSRDIGKKYLDEIHTRVFGYNTQIDPSSYEGKGVRKSDINAKHDGEIIDFPTQKIDEDSIYQLLIDNQVNENEVLDFRVPVINYKIPLFYLKYRLVSERFKNTTTKTKLANVNEFLSEDEQTKILEIARHMNVEYGEFDVLRNRSDDKIYVVDVNNTPYGPPANISRSEGKEAVRLLSAAFKEAFLK